MTAARKLRFDEAPPFTRRELSAPRTDAAAVAERRAMLLALPLSGDPPSPEEDAIFEEAERFARSGQQGHTTEEMLALLDEMRASAG